MSPQGSRAYGVIYLGASHFTDNDELDKASFAASRDAIAAVLTEEYLIADKVEKLDLFDEDIDPLGIVERTNEFLTAHPKLTDLIIYYCGHGGFLPGDSFYLTLKTTKEKWPAATGLSFKQFQHDLEPLLIDKRIYLILDCCYAAAAVKDWQLVKGVDKVIANEIEALFPPTGAALLCAASRRTPALAPSERDTTLFTGHFVDAVQAGIEDERETLTFSDLADSIFKSILRERPRLQVLPELHVPRQPRGNPAQIPFVRNAGVLRPEPSAPAPEPKRLWNPFYSSVQLTISPLELFGIPPAAPPLEKSATEGVSQGKADDSTNPPIDTSPETDATEVRQKSRRAPRRDIKPKRQAKKPKPQAMVDETDKVATAQPASSASPPDAGGEKVETGNVSGGGKPPKQTVEGGGGKPPSGDGGGGPPPLSPQPGTPSRGVWYAVASIAVVALVLIFGLLRLQSPPAPPSLAGDATKPGPEAPTDRKAERIPATKSPSEKNDLAKAPPQPKPNPPKAKTAYCGSTPAQPKRASAAATGGVLVPATINPNERIGPKGLHALAIAPDASLIATGGDDGYVRIWDANSFKLKQVLSDNSIRNHADPEKLKIHSVDFAFDGSNLLVAAASLTGAIRIWNARTGDLLYDQFNVTGEEGTEKQYAVTFYPRENPRYLYSAGADRFVYAWDLQDKALDRKNSPKVGKSAIRSISVSPTGELVVGNWGGEVIFHDKGNTIPAKGTFNNLALGLAYSPDGTRLLAGGRSGNGQNVKIWSDYSQDPVSYKVDNLYSVSVAWSPDGKTFASAGGGNKREAYSIQLWKWNAQSSNPIHSYSGHTADVEALAFAAKGERLISVGDDGTMRVWDVATEKELLQVIPYNKDSYLAFTPAGCYSGSTDVDKYFTFKINGVSKPIDAKAMYNPDGFSVLAVQ